MQVSRFEAQCGECIGDISPGDEVEFDQELGWIHADPSVCEEVLEDE